MMMYLCFCVEFALWRCAGGDGRRQRRSTFWRCEWWTLDILLEHFIDFDILHFLIKHFFISMPFCISLRSDMLFYQTNIDWTGVRYGTPYLFTSANLKLTLPSDVILRRTTFFQPISPPSGPCNVPWFSSETLAIYKSLTYLFIYWLIDIHLINNHRPRSSDLTVFYLFVVEINSHIIDK